MQKELIIKDNALILQIVSMRNKETGLYVPTMDGNVNLNLNRIYTQIKKGHLSKCFMTLPLEQQIDSDSLKDLIHLNETVFEKRINFLHINSYGKDVGETREMMMDIDNHTHFENIDQLISNFPVRFEDSIIDIPNAEIIYDYSLTKLSDHDNSPSAKYFGHELQLSKKFETYLFSDIQIEYWSKYSDNIGRTIFRSSNMMNRNLTGILAQKNAKEIHTLPYGNFKKDLEIFISDNPASVFFPSRIDDPRYEFERIVKETIENHSGLIISNPTSVALPTYLNPLINSGKLFVFDETLSKRVIYFHILWHHRLGILHYEKDMHLGLIEQYMISGNLVLHQFTNEQINSYIQDAK